MPATNVPRDLRILMLEDNATDAELVGRALRAAGLPHLLCRASTRATFVLGLDHLEPDVILVDCIVPGFDGRTAIRLAREQKPAVPVIVVTGVPLDLLVAGLKTEGACDYVPKDQLERLAPAISRAKAGGAGRIRARPVPSRPQHVRNRRCRRQS